jgi:hypothetical protein
LDSGNNRAIYVFNRGEKDLILEFQNGVTLTISAKARSLTFFDDGILKAKSFQGQIDIKVVFQNSLSIDLGSPSNFVSSVTDISQALGTRVYNRYLEIANTGIKNVYLNGTGGIDAGSENIKSLLIPPNSTSFRFKNNTSDLLVRCNLGESSSINVITKEQVYYGG